MFIDFYQTHPGMRCPADASNDYIQCIAGRPWSGILLCLMCLNCC